jgi:hypothetical protein
MEGQGVQCEFRQCGWLAVQSPSVWHSTQKPTARSQNGSPAGHIEAEVQGTPHAPRTTLHRSPTSTQ